MPVSLVRLTVPGNILLLGEYAVLEEGGLGLAMAVDIRVRVEASPAESLLIEALWSGSTLSWTPGRPGESLLIDAVVDAVTWWLRRECGARIRVDSTDFFSTDGRKSGLGSSAAVSVALVCGLLHAAGALSAARGLEARMLAMRAHRRAQGGRGSGYDIVTSFHGGTGLFRGGADPGWDPCALSGDPRVLIFAGPAPVSTADAVSCYGRWKERNPGAARDYLQESTTPSFRLSGPVPLLRPCRGSAPAGSWESSSEGPSGFPPTFPSRRGSIRTGARLWARETSWGSAFSRPERRCRRTMEDFVSFRGQTRV